MDERFDRYLVRLAATAREGGTEHTDRSALEALLNAFAEDAMAPGISVQHEPLREKGKGAPDFKVKQAGMIRGYVEVKQVGENLDKVLKSEQIKKYRTLSDNIVLTDYLQFIRINSAGKVLARAQLAYPTDLEGRKITVNADRATEVAQLLEGFFSVPPEGIGRSQQLAIALATRSKLLRDFLVEELLRQEKNNKEGRLHGLFDVFREQVFHELTTKEFADAFAQMLAYGLFLAKLNAKDDEVIRLDNVRRFIPGSFSLIRELVRFLEEMQEHEYDEIRWVVDEILSIVNGLAIEKIRGDLSFRQRKAVNRKVRAKDEEEHRLFERDPFIYFYEDYLKAYDKETRKSRGVYYTPPPVVNFIVRAVDDILKDIFKIADGLADNKKVTVLDFAAGTGTFLLEVMQKIFDNIGGPGAGKADAVVREHILKNLYGFEYLIAPYTIAHLKLSQYLKDRGHALHDDERLQVYLTNTLEPIDPQYNALLPQLSQEVEAAQRVKEKPILVILGNPPYSGHSKNKGAWISQAIDGYKYTVETVETGEDADGKPVYKEEKRPLGERNPKWLNDDYVKFIRFAQLKMDEVEEGIVGIITNHSWLDNPTFRGMRQSLMRTFDQIYVLDLHGNFKKKERAPGGGKDENVFDIEQGVAISLFVKSPELEKGIWRGDIWGERIEKYQELTTRNLEHVSLQKVTPLHPYFLLKNENRASRKDYDEGIAVPEIFSQKSVGLVTGRDKLAMYYHKSDAFTTLQVFISLSVEDARSTFRLGKDAKDWKIDWAQNDLRESGLNKKNFVKISNQPFDYRWTYYTGRASGFHVRPRQSVSDKMLSANIAIVTNRSQEIPGEWSNVLVSDNMVTHHAVSNKEVNTVFPLLNNGPGQSENLSPDFRDFLDTRYDHHYSPEEIFGYIYAVLHAPTYRTKYAEFLRIDFPRVPFPEKAKHFEALSALGWALVEAHLMRDLPRTKLGELVGKGGNMVEHVRWSKEDQTVSINKTQGFAPVPEDVWNFHIGGYQMLDKYLKSRKGRKHFSEKAAMRAMTIR